MEGLFGIGDAAMRVVPYFRLLDGALFLVALVLLLIIAIVMGQVNRGIRESAAAQAEQIHELIAEIQKLRAQASQPSPALRQAEAGREAPPPTQSTEPASVRKGYEEFGPMTESEHNMARIYGREALRQSREAHK